MKTITTPPIPLRAVQLDLARQKETLETIGDFISFASEWGYNTLFLYLEGVVQTNAFPHRERERSYDKNDVRQILGMASAAGLEVIPGLATLGHANQFFEHECLSHLRESGSWSPNMFCPSHPGTYEFIEAYVKEVAALFPSRHVHIGCDEAWALGSCPACRARLSRGERREDLFIQHVLRLHRLLGGLGKRVWLWSDMLETFSPAALERIPRDVVLCEWQYEAGHMSFDGFQGHFNNLRRRDVLALHAKSGHDTVLCGAGEWSGGGNDWSNGIAIAEIGRDRNLFGCLLTNWGIPAVFLPGCLPAVALMGRLWSHPEEGDFAAFATTFGKLFPNATESERLVLRYSTCGHLLKAKFFEIVYRGRLTIEEVRHLCASLAHVKILEDYLARLPEGRERDIVEETLSRVRLQACLGLARQALARLIDPRISAVANVESQREFQSAMREMELLVESRLEHWSCWREGISPNTASKFIHELCESLKQFFSKLSDAPNEKRGIMSLRLFLIESYSAPRLTVDIHEGNEWIEVFRGSHKPANLRDASYLLEIPIFWEYSEPQKLRIKVSGYGGQGVQFASVLIGNRKWIPERILNKHGLIRDAEALVQDDAFVSFLGEKDTLKTLESFSHKDEAVLEIKLMPGK